MQGKNCKVKNALKPGAGKIEYYSINEIKKKRRL